MFTQYIIRGWAGGSENLTQQLPVTGTATNYIDEAIPAGSTNLSLEYNLDVENLQCLFILSDQVLTLGTNSSTTPANTFNLEPGVPFQYLVGDPALKDSTGAVVVDITQLFATNAGAAAANLKIRALTNA